MDCLKSKLKDTKKKLQSLAIEPDNLLAEYSEKILERWGKAMQNPIGISKQLFSPDSVIFSKYSSRVPDLEGKLKVDFEKVNYVTGFGIESDCFVSYSH